MSATSVSECQILFKQIESKICVFALQLELGDNYSKISFGEV